MGLIRKIFWVVMTLIFALLFSVLFEYGTYDFGKNVERELTTIRDFIKPVKKKSDLSDKIPAK